VNSGKAMSRPNLVGRADSTVTVAGHLNMCKASC